MDSHQNYGKKIRDVSKAFKNRVDTVAFQEGLNASYFHIFFVLDKFKVLTQKELAKKCLFAAPTISATLKSMEIQGLLTREQDNLDQRKIMVKLTDKGKKMSRSIIEIFHKVDDISLQGIDKTSLEVFENVLMKIMKNLQEGE